MTRKITRAAARIKLGVQKELFLNNLDAKRDWGSRATTLQAMWMMLQTDQPDDYVIATGETHTVREFLDRAFGHVELDWHDYVRSILAIIGRQRSTSSSVMPRGQAHAGMGAESLLRRN